MKEEYTVLDYEDGIKYCMTLEQILEEINRDRSPQWEEFDETDWREGLAEFTTLEVIEE